MTCESREIQIEQIIDTLTSDVNIELLEATAVTKIMPREIVVGNLVNNIVVSADMVALNQPLNQIVNMEKKTESASLAGNEIIFITVKDIIFNLILNNKSLRSKLNELLDSPHKAVEDISKIFNEISEKMTAQDVDTLRRFVSLENTRSSIGSILSSSFNDIMADGKIDLNDTNHFLTLVYNIVNLFNNYTETANVQFSLSSDTIFFFLYFIIKCTLILTLDGEDETTALGLLDTTFKLVRISIFPISNKKCTCNFFSCFTKK